MSRVISWHGGLGVDLKPGDVAPFVFVPGDPRRVDKFAAYWDGARVIARHNEFYLVTGSFDGVPVSACCTGIGGRSVAIAVDELTRAGAQTFLRVGVTGPAQEHVKIGDLIIATGALRRDAASTAYVHPGYPAGADPEVVWALIAAAERLGHTYHVGVSCTTGTFGAGEGRPGPGDYTQSFMTEIRSDMRRAGVYDYDTETATVFTLAGLYGRRAGRLNCSVADPKTGGHFPGGEQRAVETALEAVRILAHWDAAGGPALAQSASEEGKRHA